MANSPAPAPAPRNQPVHEVRLGGIKAAIWQNQTEAGVRYNVTFERLYNQEGEWRSTGSFGRDDLLLLGKVADLAHAVRARTGPNQRKYSFRQAAYDLTKLRGKELVKRRDKSPRYVSDPSGVRTMCGYPLLREQGIKPLLAGVNHRLGRPPKNVAPLDQHCFTRRQEKNRTFETLGLAA